MLSYNLPEEDQEILCPLCKDYRPIPLGSKRGIDGSVHDYNQCVACDLIYAIKLPTAEMYAQVYQGNYPERDIRKETIKLAPIINYLKLRKRMRGNKSKLSVLDIGSRFGEVTAAARNLSCVAFGLEKDPKAVALAKNNYPDMHFYAMSIEAFAKLGQTFDFINCNDVIQQAPDIHLFAQALHTLSHEHTVLHLTTPNLGHIKAPKNLIDWPEIQPVKNLRLFSKEGIGTLLERHGINVKVNLPMLKTSQRLLCKIAAVESDEDDED